MATEDSNELLQAYGLASKAGDQEAMQDLHSRIVAAQPKHDVTSDMSTGERLVAGVGHGIERMNEGLANMLGAGPTMQRVSDALKKIPGLRNFPLASANFTDEGLQSEDQAAKPLLTTTAGKVGDVAGQVAATAPLGMGSGALMKGVGPVLARGGTLGAGGLRLALGAGENAIQSGAMSDPEHQGVGLAEGAALGAGLGLAGKAAGKAVRGLVPKSEALQRLEADAEAQGKDLFVPISQGAKPGIVKSTYQHALPYAMGVEGRLGRQSQEAQSTMRDVLAEQGMPVQETGKGLERMKAPLAETPEATAANIKDTMSKEYQDKLNAYTFNSPNNFLVQVAKDVKDAHPELPENQISQIATTIDQRLSEYTKNGEITGGNLKAAKEAATEDLGKLQTSGKVRDSEAIKTGLKSIDDVIDSEIARHEDIAKTGASPIQRGMSKQVAEDLRNYQRLENSQKEIKPVTEAVEASPANRGEFKFSDVASRAEPGTHARSTAQDAAEVLERENSGSVNPAGRHLLHTVGGFGLPVAALASGHPLGAAATIGIPNLLATKGVQKGLYGDLATQRALAIAIRNNPQAAYSAGLAARSAVDASGQ